MASAALLVDGSGDLSEELAPLDLPGRLRAIAEAVEGRLVFTTSFGVEDQAITHAIAATGIKAELATLDTGRLFPETYTVWEETEERYRIPIRAIYPDSGALQELVDAHGINGFRRSVEWRLACCGVRKVEPLARALEGARGWITGLRAGQSRARAATPLAAWDAERRLIKFGPLADWSGPQVRAYVDANDVPINPLHDQGFLSIGCAPCTRAVAPGEDERAGRWWWENEEKKECGLHLRRAPRALEAA